MHVIMTVSFTIRREDYRRDYLMFGDNYPHPLSEEDGDTLGQWVRETDEVHIVKHEDTSTSYMPVYITWYEIWDERIGALFLLKWKK